MGGAQLQAKYLLEELVSRQNVEVNFLASRVSDSIEPDDTYTLTRINKPGALHRYGLFWDYFALNKKLLAFRPHVIYQRVANAYTGICARYGKQHSVPMIWHVANSTDCDRNNFDTTSLRRPHAYLERWFAEYGLKHASQIIVQNKDQKTLLETNFGKHNSQLIPNFHPIPEINRQSKSEPLRVLWIANLKDSKRPGAMLETAQYLSERANIEITMVGAPYSQAEKFKQDAFELSVGKLPKLTYTGAMPLEEVNGLLEQNHLLVNTSIKEGFSNTFIQAWLRCVPVYSLGVNPDNRLDGGPLGQSFSSTRALADAIIERSSYRDKLEKDGATAREVAIADFSLENAKTLADLLLSFAMH